MRFFERRLGCPSIFNQKFWSRNRSWSIKPGNFLTLAFFPEKDLFCFFRVYIDSGDLFSISIPLSCIAFRWFWRHYLSTVDFNSSCPLPHQHYIPFIILCIFADVFVILNKLERVQRSVFPHIQYHCRMIGLLQSNYSFFIFILFYLF